MTIDCPLGIRYQMSQSQTSFSETFKDNQGWTLSCYQSVKMVRLCLKKFVYRLSSRISVPNIISKIFGNSERVTRNYSIRITFFNFFLSQDIQEIEKLLQDVDMNLKKVREKAIFNAKLVNAIKNCETADSLNISD